MQFFAKNFTLQEKSLLLRHISAMLEAGASIPEAVRSGAAFFSQSSRQKSIEDVAGLVEGGESLAQAFVKTKKFDDFFITAVQFGEKSESLQAVLSDLAEQYDAERELRSELQSAIIYPSIVFTLTLFVFGVVIFFVVPQIQPVFATLPFELPLATRLLFATTSALQNYWWALIILLLTIFFGILLLRRSQRYSVFVDTWLLRIPYVSEVVLFAEMARFSRQWALLTQHGQAPVDAIELLLPTISNAMVRGAFSQFSSVLTAGGSIDEALQGISNAHFPKMVQQALKTGMQSEEVSKSLLSLSKYLQHIVRYKTKTLITVFEPLLLIFVSLLVGLLAMSIIAPLYEVTTTVGGV